MKRAVAIVVVVLAVSWTIATPAIAAPIGTVLMVGDSMGHDQPRLAIYSDSEPEIGDVVVWNPSQIDGHVNHRVVDVDDGRPVTKGDANAVRDQTSDVVYFDHPTPSNTDGVILVSVPVLEALLVLVSATGLLYRRSLQAGAVALLRSPEYQD